MTTAYALMPMWRHSHLAFWHSRQRFHSFIQTLFAELITDSANTAVKHTNHLKKYLTLRNTDLMNSCEQSCHLLIPSNTWGEYDLKAICIFSLQTLELTPYFGTVCFETDRRQEDWLFIVNKTYLRPYVLRINVL